MTVQELFKSMTFDDIASALRHTHRNDKSIQFLAGYKEAYDTLSNIEFKGEGGEVTFDITEREHWFDKHNLPLLANGVEGDLWENIVGKEVLIPENNPFTDAELAGAILWGATFYGFNRHNRWSPFEEIYSNYGEKAWKLERKQYLPYIRNKKTKYRLKKDIGFISNRISFSMEDWNQIHYREKHQNRSKRKRFYRMGKRIEWLQKLDKRQNLINTIRETTGLTLDDFAHKVINAGSIHETWFESHTYGKSDRIKYLVELIEKYMSGFNQEFNDCDEVYLFVYSTIPSMSESELSELSAFCKSYFQRNDIKIIPANHPDLKDEIELQFIRISSHIINDQD